MSTDRRVWKMHGSSAFRGGEVMTEYCRAAQLIDSGCWRSRRDPLDLDSELELPGCLVQADEYVSRVDPHRTLSSTVGLG